MNQENSLSDSVSVREQARSEGRGGASQGSIQKGGGSRHSIIVVVILRYLLKVQRTSHSVTLKHSVLHL